MSPAISFSRADALRHLARTPATIQALVDDLPASWADATDGPDTWSPAVVVAHLIHAERDNWPVRVRCFLASDGPRLLPAFPAAQALQERAGRSVPDLVAEFTQRRRESVAWLEQLELTDALLEHQAEHPEFGVVSLRQLLATWVVHDWAHIGQIARTLAAQYRDAVGPWHQYLRILGPTRSV